jgi:Rrf2 family protein
MRLSQRADYAAHAMVEIARWYGERPVHATEIAQRQGIPEPYLEQLLLALRRSALVRSYRGPGGGYTLTRPPGAISLADVVAALEGPFVPPEEGLHDSEGADDPLTCPIRDAWHLATATMRRILDGMTLEILLQRQLEIESKHAQPPQVDGAGVNV